MSGANWLRRAAAAALAAGALAIVVFLSRVPWQGSGSGEGELRVSWRIPAPSVRHCRPPSEAELEGVPDHMRPAEICNEEVVPFDLTILIDGDTLHTGAAWHPGRRARTHTVYERFPIPAGSHVLEVSFLPGAPRVDSGSPQMDSVQALATTLFARVVAAPGDVVLVTRNDSGRLVITPPGQGR